MVCKNWFEAPMLRGVNQLCCLGSKGRHLEECCPQQGRLKSSVSSSHPQTWKHSSWWDEKRVCPLGGSPWRGSTAAPSFLC